ncbi:MAG TPA: acyl-CoA dehydrogenase family protein, partial [Candidatus Binataceae bacterium]|nr:acyl-CoA dehydrogenase family protein [Candidatus Binataceae bacterium]
MIDFELEPAVLNRLKMYHAVAENMMRPISREYDEREHEKPWQFYETMWQASSMASEMQVGAGRQSEPDHGRPRLRNLMTCASTEELCWGDAGLYLSTPNSGLGGAAVMAAGTAEQKARFLKRFGEGKPKWGAMAITEPHFGSDSAAVATTAVREGDQWVLNGTKIFCT